MKRPKALDEHTSRVFDAASYFRLVLHKQHNQTATAEHPDFEAAIRAARNLILEKRRVVVYVISEGGEVVLLPPDQWDAFLKRWRERKCGYS